MKKAMICGTVFIIVSICVFSGCTDNQSNTHTGDFTKIYEASDNIIKTQLFNDSHDYHDIENMVFGDRNIEIVEANRWTVTGEFTIAGNTHSYTTEVSLVNEQYNGITTIT